MRTVDLFAGCGGMSLGFQKAGFDIVAAYDNWDTVIDCYKANFRHPIIRFNLDEVTPAAKEIRRWNPEIIIGGPPCQDFSHAGKRKEEEKANLTISYARILKTVLPVWLVMENVDRTLKSMAYSKAREILKSAGYGLTEKILDASYCGVPQKRKRFFCIGCLGEKDGFLNAAFDSNLADKPMTVREYFGDSLGVEYYYRHPRNYGRRAIFSIDEPSPTIRGVNRPVPGNYEGHPGNVAPVNTNLRPLSTLERSMIQTFPKDFKWTGSKTNVEQMVGNAVPVILAEFLGKVILEYAFMNQKKGAA